MGNPRRRHDGIDEFEMNFQEFRERINVGLYQSKDRVLVD